MWSSAATAKKEYPLTIKVDEERNIENQHGSFHFGFAGSNGGGSYGHGVTKHVFAEGSDNNLYDLTPKDAKDFIVPGTYQARFDKREMIVLVNGREIKLFIVDVKAAPSASASSTPTDAKPADVKPTQEAGVH